LVAESAVGSTLVVRDTRRVGSRVDYGGKRVVALDVLCCVFGCFSVRGANDNKFRPAFLVHDRIQTT